MPPDRTATSHGSSSQQPQGSQHATTARFSDAVSTGLPMSSVGPSHAPSLERGRACLTCRRRRVKCDGARPVCARCAKSARAHGEDPTSFSCDYDSQLKTNKAAREADSIAALAAEVAALKQQLALREPGPSAQASSIPRQDAPEVLPTAPASFETQQTRPPLEERHSSGLAPTDSPFAQTSQSVPATEQSPFEWTNANPQFTAHHQPSMLDVAVSYVELGPASAENPSGGSHDGAGQPRVQRPPSSAGAGEASFWAPGAGMGSASTSQAEAMSMPMYVAQDPSNARNPLSGSGLADLATAASPLYQLPSWSYGVLTVSGYPSDLPSMPLMRRLIDVYFAKPHLATGLIDEARFRASFAYPFDDPRSPVTCLLHGIAATAAMMVNEETFFADEPKYWLYDGQGRSSCSDYHARRAREMLQSSFLQGRQLLQVVQTSVLCVFCAYTNARYTEIWIQSAECSRMAVCIDLIHVRPIDPAMFADKTGDKSQSASSSAATASENAWKAPRRQRRLKDQSILPPTLDPDEIAERCAVFWFVYGQDRMTSAASGWAATIDEEDVTTLLPHPPGTPDTSDDPLSSPLCIHNSSFFFANPPHLVKRLQLHFKAFVLLGRVTRFLQRAPSPIGSGYAQKPGDPDIRDTAGFRALDRTVSHFSMSLPRGLQYSYYAEQSLLMEMTPLLSFTIVHVCVILMHEPFCLAPTIEATDPSFIRCLESAKAIVASVYELSGSSFETGLLYSFLNWLWAVAGRTLVRALAVKSRRGDLLAASQLAQDVQALITAMRANRSPIGTVTAQNLQRLLASPFHVLNEAFTGAPDYPHAEDEDASGDASAAEGPTPATALSEMDELAQAVFKSAGGVGSDPWQFEINAGDAEAFFR